MERSSGGARRRSTEALRSAIFREASAIVRSELSRPLRVDEVARRVASSPRQLRRAFSDAGGTSFRSFLTHARMSRAAELLESTDIAVKEVGRRVGYRQAGQFTKAFKRAYAQTPSAFRASRRS